MLSLLAKYVPGGVWTPAARVIAARRYGVDDTTLVLTSIALEAGLSAISGVLVLLVGLLLVGPVSATIWPVAVFGALLVVLVHPRVFATSAGGLPGSMAFVFVVAIVATALLFALLCSYEITAKTTRWQLRALRRRALGDEALAPAGRSAAPAIGGPGGSGSTPPRSASPSRPAAAS